MPACPLPLPLDAGLSRPAGNRAPADDLDVLSEYFLDKARRVLAMLTHLQRLAPEQVAQTTGPYRVFDCAETGQLIVLRRVAALDGATAVYETDSLTDALSWTHARHAERAGRGRTTFIPGPVATAT